MELTLNHNDTNCVSSLLTKYEFITTGHFFHTADIILSSSLMILVAFVPFLIINEYLFHFESSYHRSARPFHYIFFHFFTKHYFSTALPALSVFYAPLPPPSRAPRREKQECPVPTPSCPGPRVRVGGRGRSGMTGSPAQPSSRRLLSPPRLATSILPMSSSSFHLSHVVRR